MESREVSERSTIISTVCNPCKGAVENYSNNVGEDENLGVDLLNDLDSYLDEIRGRLTVSRMVSDSVIKGMVCAVQQEAAEKIAQKEMELARLKGTLNLCHAGADDDSSTGYSMMGHVPKIRKNEHRPTRLNCLLEHDKLQNSLCDLKFSAEEHFIKLKEEIYNIRRGSGSQLSDVLPEKILDKWFDVDRRLDVLTTTLESIYSQTKQLVCLSKSLLSDWQQERELQVEIEGLMIKNYIWSLQEGFKKSLCNQNGQSHDNVSGIWLEKAKDIASIRQYLVAISKSLSVSESGQLISHGSLELRKVSNNHVSSSIWEGNGKQDASIIIVPENLDLAQLKHFSKDELFDYFKAEMIKMKRHYESKEHEMTEEYFSLKREYLKERGSSLSVRKDKEFDTLRKKIPEVILKLDHLLTENEKFPLFNDDGYCMDNLKGMIESLRLENQQLKDLLADKKEEINYLSSQVSDAAEKILEHSLAEKNLLRMIKNIKSTTEDGQIEASICDDLYKFLLKEIVGQMEGFSEVLNMEYAIMHGIYEILMKEAIEHAECTSKLNFDDSAMESAVMQGIHEVIYNKSFKEAENEVITWNLKYICDNKDRVSIEMAALEKEQALRLNIAEKEKLEQEMLLLRATIDDNNKLVQEATRALAKEKEKSELASQELDNLRVQTMNQQKLIKEYDGELQIVKGDLNKTLHRIEMDKEEISKLREKLEMATQKFREVVDKNNELLSVSQDHQNNLTLVETREREQRIQLNSTILLVQGMLEAYADFECRTKEEINIYSLRLEKLSFELNSLIQGVNRHRRAGLLYKQKLERTTSDLQKAEAEVDLLGDEVDTLLSLLEKIYIALDHYSPILQHYPGIMDIMKLVRREFSGEPVELV